MENVNPYESPPSDHRAATVRQTRDKSRWIAASALMAAAIPILSGFYGLYLERLHIASLPPGSAVCGMGTVSSLATIVIFGPFFGMIGGAIGWIVAKLL